MEKLAICTPTLSRPVPAFLESLEASAPLLDAAGFDHSVVTEVGCPYISHARATLLRKALDVKADVIVFIDDDVSWDPAALVRLAQTDAKVCAGLYRFKRDAEEYMGELLTQPDGRPSVRHDGLLYATKVPAGFLKVTSEAVDQMMGRYPELIYGKRWHPHFDLFNHGAHGGLWWGEDYAFSRRWCEMGEYLYILPDCSLTHNSRSDSQRWPGNFHQFMLRQPGGSEATK